MKKLFFCLSLFTFCFYLIPLQAQDTLVLRNGQKMGVKVIYVTNKIFYTLPKGDTASLAFSKVEYIKYKDGSTFTIKTNGDTARVKWTPYALAAVGIDIPFAGYAATNTVTDVSIAGYAGHANIGATSSATIGVKGSNGWEWMGTFSYVRNGFNAQDVVNESLYSFIEGNNFTTVSTTGSYYYNNYGFLLGFSKNSQNKGGGVGITIMAGDIITHTRSINGVVTNYLQNSYYYNSLPIPDPGYSFNMNNYELNDFVFDIGIHGDIVIGRRVFLRIASEFQFSDMNVSGTYQFTDTQSGNVIRSGEYAGSDQYPARMFKVLWNTTAGIGYQL